MGVKVTTTGESQQLPYAHGYDSAVTTRGAHGGKPGTLLLALSTAGDDAD